MHNLPSSIVSGAHWHFVSGDLDKALAIGIGPPVTRWEDFDVVNWLYVMIVLVVVDLSVDLVLDDLVFVGFHDFVRDGCISLVKMLH
jgi:hypothetical protein